DGRFEVEFAARFAGTADEKIAAAQISAAEVAPAQDRAEVSTAQIAAAEITPAKVAASQIAAAKVSAAEIAAPQVAAAGIERQRAYDEAAAAIHEQSAGAPPRACLREREPCPVVSAGQHFGREVGVDGPPVEVDVLRDGRGVG